MKVIALFLVSLMACSCRCEDDAKKSLKDLAKRMAEMESQLREDRHDSGVQSKGKSIEDQIGQMVEDAEKQQQQQSKQEKQKQQQHQKQEIQTTQKKQQSQTPGQSMAPSSPGATDAAVVSGHSSDWAKLPKAIRDEMIQNYQSEMPSLWKKRLEAYFLSIAIEEAKKDKHGD